MSSQGPVGSGSKSSPPFCTGATGGTTGSSNYVFSTASIRDGSDWTAYKRQALIFATEKSKAEITQNQWAQYGNDYRVQWQLGKYKTNQGPTGACGGCLSGSFGGTGPAM